MSATNRGAERAENDHYMTPGFAVRAVLPLLERGNHHLGRILEPGAGTGAIGRELRVRWPDASITGVELEKGTVKKRSPYTKLYEGTNYLGGERLWRSGPEFSLAIANPPFKLLLGFVEQMLADAEGRCTCVLTRINWLAGARMRQPSRKALLQRRPPFVGILERRPSFGLNKDGKKGSDGTEYCWLVWGAGQAGKWDILDCEFAKAPPVVEAAAE